MEIDDIKKRMERVYLSIGQQFDDDFSKLNVRHETENGKGVITISFDGGSEAEILNRIFLIISHLAKLKDHLKRLHSIRGGNAEELETEIDNSNYLKLIIDLDNEEKHGQRRESRSGKNPHIVKPGSGLAIKQAGADVSTGSFAINPFTGQFFSKNAAIAITAEIRDGNDQLICSFGELVDKSIKDWESIISKYNLTAEK